MKQKNFLKLIVFLVITLSIVKLLIAGLISTSGFTLFNVKNEISKISTQNQNLHEEIVANSSFKNIQAKALSMGLQSTNSVLNYSVTSSGIAMKE